ncbi:hypothetical protein SJS40_02280 [Aeromonas caviae]|uniref:Uncharacterized protein n=1 Tax=Aeromonas caviae TaxID=648 RepID=A0AA42V939_AERCA|nr:MULTISPECIES: hypothetical protein [Aeromonas]MBP4058668.1 hypothetical protein [Aeromonas sp. Prich7-2]MDH1896684.1 hypothetical protein [Aeromonas caviae]MDX7720793.1 hypothetical protein [Aeromonas caviae]MDX7752411.1 hypothetical protein [Aeromonas caviae]MDX7775419.1 hypothetical protein [Aeromonas caviae]
MKHDNDHLKFPSGNTVEFCRKKAKKLVKEEKAKGKELKLSRALDVVAISNGIPGGWAEAMNQMEMEAACSTK